MIFIGDTHGNHAHIKWVIRHRKIENQELIHVGDFGVGFVSEETEMKILTEFNEFLKGKGNILHVFRGNHDDPVYFKGQHLFSNLKLHKDYTVLDIENKKILGIGGAVSIDRVPRRLETRSHWEDELFVLNEEFLKEVRDIDILVTHTTPSYIPPINVPGNWPMIVKHFARNDEDLCGDLTHERNLLDIAFDTLTANNNITHHFYGHFHQDITTPRYGCVHMCLNIGKTYELVDYTDYEKDLDERYSE